METQPGFVLLAEDSDEDAILMLRVFKEANWAVPIERVTDGVEALEFLRCEGKWKGREGGYPLLVLLDNKMPRMDGVEALRHIRSDDTLKLIPVLMLTSSKQHTDVLRSFNLGANAYLLKPVSFEGFAQAVKAIGLSWTLTNEALNLAHRLHGT